MKLKIQITVQLLNYILNQNYLIHSRKIKNVKNYCFIQNSLYRNLVLINNNYQHNLNQNQLINQLNNTNNVMQQISILLVIFGVNQGIQYQNMEFLMEQSNYWVQCLVYSKKQNSFISSVKQLDVGNNWTKMSGFFRTLLIAFRYYQIYDIYNSNEDFFAIFWEFEQINLSLEVISSSLNQQEDQLGSCAEGQNQIIIWGRREIRKNLNSNILLNNQFQITDQKLNLLKPINLFGQLVKIKEIDSFYLNQNKESIKKISKRLSNQIKIIKTLMNMDFQQMILGRGIQQQLDIKHIFHSRDKQWQLQIDEQLNCDTFSINGISFILDNIWCILIIIVKLIQYMYYQIYELFQIVNV
ncbi:unnamed protein product [Paramecium octaurelia]|uniref:Uncharacterized protein n=1 Tax=Paramecium octaurelia TaxID=43137 RepID=A0A8S1X5L0_PAROT|nr:unnamed protein product [Paramecium octaurelia]